MYLNYSEQADEAMRLQLQILNGRVCHAPRAHVDNVS